MTDLKEAFAKWGARIQQASKLLDDVEAKLDCRRKEQRQRWRHIPVLANFEYVIPDITQTRTILQEQNWLNGGEDVHIQGVMTSVWATLPESDSNPLLNFVKTDAGYAIRLFNEGSSCIRYLDFGWNIRTGRTGQYVLSPANNGLLMGSTTLRKDRAGKVHWFSSSLRVPAGENVLVQMKPLRTPGMALPRDTLWDSTRVKIHVSIALYGTRTGALHVR